MRHQIKVGIGGVFRAGWVIALLAIAHPLPGQISEEAAVEYVKKIPVSKLESGLKDQPFGEWLTEAAGPGAELTWEMNDCGEQTGDPAIDKERDLPVCVSASGELPDGRSIAAMILVGTWERGLVGEPDVYDVYWTEGKVVHQLERLNELPDVVRSRPEDATE